MAKNSLKWLALLGGVALGAASMAVAQDSGALIDALVKKGILTDQEAEDIRVDLTKEFAATSPGKINLSSSLKELKISGDARVRYEYRSGEAGVAVPSATPGATVPLGNQQERNRFRYRLRLGLDGKYGDGFFFGTRIEPLGNNRSTNVTAGNGVAANGPFNKEDSLAIGRAFVGYKVDDFTFTAGRMANPLVTTSMVWDDDLNPEGLAEQWSHEAGKVTWFANLGQFVYEGSGTTNPINVGASRQNTYLWAFQGGAKAKVSDSVTVQAAPALYTYSGNATGLTALNATNNANTLQTRGLQVVDIPIEVAFKLGGLPAKVYGDYAMNLNADQRARAAGLSAFDGEDSAYQIGFGLGASKVKGDWEARVFYQATEAFALDSNLVDSDLFDGRTNMEGWWFTYNYVITDGVSVKFTYAAADRKNDRLNTFGAGDIGTAKVNNYQLFQADLNIKF